MEKIIEKEIICVSCKGTGRKADAMDIMIGIFTFGFGYDPNYCEVCNGRGKTTLKETVFDQNIKGENTG